MTHFETLRLHSTRRRGQSIFLTWGGGSGDYGRFTWFSGGVEGEQSSPTEYKGGLHIILQVLIRQSAQNYLNAIPIIRARPDQRKT